MIYSKEMLFQPKFSQLERFLTTDLDRSKENEDLFNTTLLGELRCDSFSDLQKLISPYVVTITLAAGEATRMTQSISDPKNAEILAKYQLKDMKARATIPVDNVTKEYFTVNPKPVVANGIYSLMALRTPDNKPLGTHILVHAPGQKEAMKKTIVEPLRIPEDEITYAEQVPPRLGHGDALLQLLQNIETRRILEEKPIWLVNFAGDANSPIRIAQSLGSLYLLAIRQGMPIKEIIPAAKKTNPAYPIYLEANNIPSGTAQLRNGVIPGRGRKSDWMNCGIRVVLGEEAAAILSSWFPFYRKADYRNINPSGLNDLPIDILDNVIMDKGQVRILGLSDVEETQAVKKVSDIPHFKKKVYHVLTESYLTYKKQYGFHKENKAPTLTSIAPKEGRFIFSRENLTKYLPNVMYIERLAIDAARNTVEWKAVSEFFGTGAKKILEKKVYGRNAVAATEYYGYGHLFQSHAIAKAASHIGITTYGVLASDLATHREGHATLMKQKLLETIHHKKGMSEIFQLIETKSPLDFLEDIGLSYMMLMTESYLRSAGLDFLNHKNLLFDPFTKIYVKLTDVNKDLTSFLFREIAKFDIRFIDRPLRKGLESFFEATHSNIVFHTHAAPARALLGTLWEERSIYFLPDPGYAAHLAVMLPLAVVSKHMPLVIPKAQKVRMMLERYGVPVANIFEAGTLTEPVDKAFVEKKWNRNMKRRVLIPLSGSGNGLQYIKEALKDFADYKKLHPNNPYELVIYLGNHRNSDTEAIKKMKTVLGLEHGVEIKEANNMSEVAKIKWEEKKKAHVEISKGGESAIDTQALATLHLALKGVGPNEDYNTAYSYERYGSSLPSAWPTIQNDTVNMRKFWKNSSLFKDAITSFPHRRLFEDGAPSNLFVQLDFLWETGIAKETALKAFQKADITSSLTGLAIAAGSLSGDDRFDIHGSSGKAVGERIRSWQKEIEEELKRN